MGERLVVAHYQRRALELLDDISHRECLTRSRHAKQCDGIHSVLKGGADAFDCSRLVAGRPVFRIYLEFHIANILNVDQNCPINGYLYSAKTPIV